MNKLSKVFILLSTLIIISCSSSNQIITPLSKELPNTKDNYTILWVGTGESYIYNNGKYLRSPSNDYTFEVTQRRYSKTWKSTKSMHRIHPDYNGKAGPREQNMYFEIDFSKYNNNLVSKIHSSLGEGHGISDFEFRKQTIELPIDNISSMAPYNTLKITQNYLYEEGILEETVELYKLKNGIKTPFVKIEEKAIMFRPSQFKEAPTYFKE